MKHLFIVNSHTTFLTSLGTIDFLKLKKNEVVIVYIRNYKNALMNLPYKEFNLSKEYTYCMRRPYNVHGFKKIIRSIDKIIIDAVDKEEYIMYAPSPGSCRLFQIIFSNQKCVGMNYLQEGALVFDKLFEASKLPLRYKVYDYMLRLLYKHRIWANYFSWRMPEFLLNKKKVPECYAISSDIFQKLPYVNNLIKWPVFNIENTNFQILPQYPCFIFESSVEMGVIEREIYMEYTKKLIEDKAEEMNYLKFHPAQSEENKQEIISYFEATGKQYKVLSMDFPFEIYISTYTHMKVYGFNSSLLVFAKQCGHCTYSLEAKLIEKSTKYSKWRKQL